MPFITVTLTQPLVATKKQELLQQITEAAMQTLAAPLPSVRIVLHELPQGHYFCGGKADVAAVLFDIEMITGRTEQARAALITALSGVAHQVTGISEGQIRVRISEFSKDNFGVENGLTAKAAGR